MPVVDLTFDAKGALIGAREYDRAADMVGKSTDNVVKHTNRTSGAFSSLAKGARSSFNTIGMVVAGAQAIVGGALVTMGAKAIKMASDLEETTNKFDVVFRGMEDSAKSWEKQLRSSFFMSREESRRYLSSIQDLLVPMGMASDQAGQMSFEVTKLAADLGSFNNLSTDKVMEDIQSALVGNYETMKKYGVVLNSTIIQEKALAAGLAKSKDELTAANKAQAAYMLMMEGSAAAIGDFARSQGSFANQLKILQGNWSELVTTIGERFLPVATEVISVINRWMSDQQNLDMIINGTIETVRFFYNALYGLRLVLDMIIVGIAKFAEFTVRGFRMIMKPIDDVFDALVKLGAMESNPFNALTETVEMFSASAIEGLNNTWNTIEKGNAYFDRLKTKAQQTADTSKAVSESAAQSTTAVGAMTSQIDKTTQSVNSLTAAVQQNSLIGNAMSAAGIQGEGEDGEDVSWSTGGYTGEGSGYGDTWSYGGDTESGTTVINNNFNQDFSKQDIADINTKQSTEAART